MSLKIAQLEKLGRPYQVEKQLKFNQWNENKDQYLILDTSTTGLDKGAEICEIAIIDLSGEVLFHSLVKPFSEIEFGAKDYHGITDDMVEEAPNWLEIWPEVYELIENKELLIYNAEFDTDRMIDSFYAFYKHDQMTKDEVYAKYDLIQSLKTSCVMQEYSTLINYGSYTKLTFAYRRSLKGNQSLEDRRAVEHCQAVREIIQANHSPEITEMDIERARLKEELNDVCKSLDEVTGKINELVKKQEKLLQQKDLFITFALMDNEQFKSHLTDIKQEIAASSDPFAADQDDLFTDDGKPLDISDDDLPF